MNILTDKERNNLYPEVINKSKRLKLNDPMLYTHTIIGTVFSLLEEENLSWVYNNFAQIRYCFDWKMFIFEDHINLFENCPCLKKQYFMIKDEKEEGKFIDMLINIIDQEYYIYLYLDRLYIVPELCNTHFAHTTLISGYDKEKQVFYVSDNYNNGKFQTIEVDFYVVEKAFYAAKECSTGNTKDNDKSEEFSYLRSICVFKYVNGINVKFDKKEFIRQLEEYITSKESNLFNDSNKSYYGYDSYRAIREFCEGNKEILIGKRDFHLLYEHKYLMRKRIEYFLEKNIIKNHELLDQAIEIQNSFHIIRNLYLKIKIMLADDNDDKVLREQITNKILSKIDASLKKEKAFIEVLIEEIIKFDFA